MHIQLGPSSERRRRVAKRRKGCIIACCRVPSSPFVPVPARRPKERHRYQIPSSFPPPAPERESTSSTPPPRQQLLLRRLPLEDEAVPGRPFPDPQLLVEIHRPQGRGDARLLLRWSSGSQNDVLPRRGHAGGVGSRVSPAVGRWVWWVGDGRAAHGQGELDRRKRLERDAQKRQQFKRHVRERHLLRAAQREEGCVCRTQVQRACQSTSGVVATAMLAAPESEAAIVAGHTHIRRLLVVREWVPRPEYLHPDRAELTVPMGM